MLKEILKESENLITLNEAHYFDGTFGRGGHAIALLQAYPHLKAYACDQDLEAVQYALDHYNSWIQEGRLTIRHGTFHEFKKWQLPLMDFMLLDLGVSSPQLDQGHRGFSFYHEGPLDMRMNQSSQITAADLIHNLSEDELNQLFIDYGEISRPQRVVSAILHDRKTKRFETTRDLAGLIERIDGWRKKGFHPATQYFLALRMKVNNELSGLEDSLTDLMHGLRTKGRLAVLTFHSLEDRIVKNIFKNSESLGRPLYKKVIQPDWSEAKINVRARSAKLRIFERGSHQDDAKSKYQQFPRE